MLCELCYVPKSMQERKSICICIVTKATQRSSKMGSLSLELNKDTKSVRRDLSRRDNQETDFKEDSVQLGSGSGL